MAKAIEDGLPKRRIEEASARTQARIDAGRQSVVGVNRYKPEVADEIPVLKVDNTAVRERQLEKLKRLRAERDPVAVEAALTALNNGAAGNGNLLELSVDAARAKATVGEINWRSKRCSAATPPRPRRSPASTCASPAPRLRPSAPRP